VSNGTSGTDAYVDATTDPVLADAVLSFREKTLAAIADRHATSSGVVSAHADFFHQ
jgi:hypothetical protein